jgi:hypothetical protein
VRYLSDGPPCTTARCEISSTLNGPACGSTILPSRVRARLDKALDLIDQGSTATGRTSTRLLKQARRTLRAAGRAAASASHRKKGKVSAGCAAELRRTIGGIGSGLVG